MTNAKKKRARTAPPLHAPKRVYVALITNGPYAGDWEGFALKSDAQDAARAWSDDDEKTAVLTYVPEVK